MTQTPSRDWQKDMERVKIFEHAKALCNNPFPPTVYFEHTEVALKYWLQEAKERGRKERILKDALEHCIKEYPLYDSKEIGGSLMMDYMKNIMNILYPDTPAPKEGD